MIRCDNDEDPDQEREVYARFGLAVYFAQVLEHGIVNALAILHLIPTQRHLTGSREEWTSMADVFFGRHFGTTMGRMMKGLRGVVEVPADLDGLLSRALTLRNWLAHDFFRERAVEFLTPAGRAQMLREIDEARSVFQDADKCLEQVVTPARIKAGITDEVLGELHRRMLGPSNG